MLDFTAWLKVLKQRNVNYHIKTDKDSPKTLKTEINVC
jgi:hypothetical protein